MTIYQDVELSMTGHLVPPVIHVKQYDHKARKVRCQLYSNSLEYTPPNNIILVYSGTRPDGKFFSYSSETSDLITSNGVTVIFTVTDFMTKASGRYPVDIVLMDEDGDVLGAFCLTLYVERAAVKNWRVAASLYKTIAQAIGRGVYECFTTIKGYFGIRSDDGLNLGDSESSNVERVKEVLVNTTIDDSGYLNFATDDNLDLMFDTDEEGRIIVEYGEHTDEDPRDA